MTILRLELSGRAETNASEDWTIWPARGRCRGGGRLLNTLTRARASPLSLSTSPTLHHVLNLLEIPQREHSCPSVGG